MRSVGLSVAVIAAYFLGVGCRERCGPDEAQTYDGCVPLADGPAWDEETLPGYRLRPCSLESGDGALNLVAGCAHGVCAGDPFTAWVAALGPPTECDPLASSVTCHWRPDGLFGTFDDADDDGRADPDSVPYSVAVNDRAGGLTSEGLGVGESLACFVQELGTPSEIEADGGESPVSLDFDTELVHLHVSDLYGQNGGNEDGYVDLILLALP